MVVHLHAHSTAARLAEATAIRSTILDPIVARHPKARVVVMGDMNSLSHWDQAYVLCRQLYMISIPMIAFVILYFQASQRVQAFRVYAA